MTTYYNGVPLSEDFEKIAKQLWGGVVDYLSRDADALSDGNSITDNNERNGMAVSCTKFFNCAVNHQPNIPVLPVLQK